VEQTPRVQSSSYVPSPSHSPPLIAAARRGDRQAQGHLLRDLQDPWYRLCVSLLSDAEKARDAAQETALRFLKALPTYRGASTLMTWSMGIAINVVREMRRSRRHASTDDERLAAPLAERGPLPPESAENSEDRRLVRELLLQLPERQREAVVLRFFEEMSVEQTATAMDCAEGTVKATIHQALRSLRKRMGLLV
jgi:RNA polymerase sigma-70 factor (ECF subfamily)